MGRYDCYMLRIWRSEGEHGEQWACRIEHMSSAERLLFNDPEALLRHLRERFAPGGAANSRYRLVTDEEGDGADEPPRRWTQYWE